MVTMAKMVPVGIDFWASLRSPDRFEPAMIPLETEEVRQGKEEPRLQGAGRLRLKRNAQQRLPAATAPGRAERKSSGGRADLPRGQAPSGEQEQTQARTRGTDTCHFLIRTRTAGLLA